MKKYFNIFLFALLTMGLSSCYTYTYNVGAGAQKGVEVKGHNHYFIFGLAQGGQSEPGKMAGDTKDYTVKIQHTFIDGLIQVITFGIYTPTTTTITK